MVAQSSAGGGRGQADRQQVQPPFGFGPRGGPGGPFSGMFQTGRAKDTQGTLQRLWGYLRRQRLLLAVVVVLVLANTGLGLLGPYLFGRAIDKYILTHDLPG